MSHWKTLFYIALLSPLAMQAQDRLMDRKLRIQSSRISIHAECMFATTVIEMTIYNPHPVEAEALETFRLQDGQVISGLELDLHGHFRKGSIEERWKASNAYNSVVGKRIDPALLQQIGHNYYRLNVYPVAARSTRRVRIHITQWLTWKNDRLQYLMPEIPGLGADSLFVAVNIPQGASDLKAGTGIAEGLTLIKNDSRAIQGHACNVLLNKALAFSFSPGNKTMVQAGFNIQNQPYTVISLQDNFPDKQKIDYRSLHIYWDASASMKNRLLNEELQFLKKFLKQEKPEQLTVTFFNQRVLSSVVSGNSDEEINELIEYIRSYDPKRSFKPGKVPIHDPNGSPILVFTDGHQPLIVPKKPNMQSIIHCISSGNFRNDPYLNAVSEQNSGQRIVLHEKNIRESIDKIAFGSTGISKVIDGNQSIPFRALQYRPAESRFIVLSHAPRTDVQVRVGTVRNDEALARSAQFPSHCMLPDSLAKSLHMLVQFDSVKSDRWMSLLSFGLREKIVTYRTSFIVLERIEDYIQYKIEPPDELIEPCRQMNYVYNKAEKLRIMYGLSDEEHIQQLIGYVKPREQWWTKQSMKEIILRENQPTAQISVNRQGAAQADAMFQSTASGNINLNNSSELSSVVVTAYGTQRQSKMLGYSTRRISANELVQAKPIFVTQGLTGKVSGLVVQSLNNSVFADTRITLRGIRSLTGNNQPMLVLDDMPINLGLLSSINPNDIEDVTILKPGSATAIYGSDGVNGVIIVKTKKGKRSYYRNHFPGKQKLNNLEDVDYVSDMKAASGDMILQTYLELQKEYKNDPVFFYDMAELLHQKGFTDEAYEALYHCAELIRYPANRSSIAYMLESWKDFSAAKEMYRQILGQNPGNLAVKRDLALAYYQTANIDSAAQLYYEIVMTKMDEELIGSLHSIQLAALQELNALLFLYPDEPNMPEIDPRLIFTLPEDLRISVCAQANYFFLHVQAPMTDSALASFPPNTDQHRYRYYGYNNQVMEYSVYRAMPGKYKVHLSRNYYYQQGNEPEIYRLVTFKNFQQRGQKLEIQNLNLTYQYGDLEVSSVKW